MNPKGWYLVKQSKQATNVELDVEFIFVPETHTHTCVCVYMSMCYWSLFMVLHTR